MLIEQVVFSEKNRLGIGTFSPSDPKSQDISELTGSIDLATIGTYGAESDPRAYRFDGELNVANRGLMEFIEMLKADEKFLYSLLTLSQEQNIKTGRFAMIYADEVIISHTNETEYVNFVNNKRAEALHDRIIVIKVSYNLRVSDEVKIHEKLLKQAHLRNVHVAPDTLRVASTFAVLSRLEAVQKSRHELDEEAQAVRRRRRRRVQPARRQGAAGRVSARRHGRHLAALRHQCAVAHPGARRRRVRQSDRRLCAPCATASNSTPASAASGVTSC